MSAATVSAKARTGAAQGIRAFYSRPIGWVALIVTSVSLAYVGGGAMFWFHAIYRGEAGPPINDWYHWFFDSSLGFVALTPALFFILPGALVAIDRAGIASARVKAAAYVALVGVAFGVITGPGPLLHDVLVGRTAPLGRLAVDIFGRDPEVAARAANAHSTLSEIALQVVVGAPVYVVTGLVALGIVRALARKWSRA
ncbi:MAG: hypothetical protein HYU54_02565 [Actinobacteria bacterium]|nr:hypothetical protein [Actinomycetota bacterium]